MITWARATEDPSGDTIWVNLALAIKMDHQGSLTTILFPGQERVSVKESPQTLMATSVKSN
jgi:hypothetical protein